MIKRILNIVGGIFTAAGMVALAFRPLPQPSVLSYESAEVIAIDNDEIIVDCSDGSIRGFYGDNFSIGEHFTVVLDSERIVDVIR